MPWNELTGSRKLKRWEHDSGDGRQRISACISPLNYESTIDSGVFDSTVDMTPQRINNAQLNGWRVTANGYHFAYQGFDAAQSQPERGTLAFGGRKGQHWLGLRPHRIGYLHWPTRTPQFIGGTATFATPTLTTNTVPIGKDDADPNVINVNLGFRATIADLWTTPGGGSVDWEIHGNGGILKQALVINQAARDWIETNAPPTTPAGQTWFGIFYRVEWRDIPRVLKSAVLQNITDGDFELNPAQDLRLETALNERLGFVGPGEIYVRNRGGRVDIRQRWYYDGSDWWLAIGGNVADINNDLVDGDLVIDPPISEESVQQDSDDAYQDSAGNMNLNGYNQQWFTGDYNGYPFTSGLRFQSIPIAQGATINSASITAWCTYEDTRGNPDVDIYCEDVDDAGTFTTANNNIGGRTRTTATTNFTNNPINGQDYTWSGLSDEVQEVVNRSGWASNNAIVFLLINGNSPANSSNGFQDYGGAQAAARFNASTAAAGAGAPIPIPVRKRGNLLHRL